MTRTCAIILGGGQGRRVATISNGRPKPLIELAPDFTILDHQIEQLKEVCSYVIIAAGPYDSEYLDYSIEKDLIYDICPDKGIGTALAVNRIVKSLEGLIDSVFILNGDIVSNFSMKYLPEDSNSIVVTRAHMQYGLVEIDDEDNVFKFDEKPLIDGWINAGIYRLKVEDILKLDVYGGSFEESILKRLELTAIKYLGQWISVDSPKDLDIAKEIIK